MREIISFNKEIPFKTKIYKITSISLEHTLKKQEENIIDGNFILAGTYRMTGTTNLEEAFNYKIPANIIIDGKYDTKDVEVDIDNFTYEVVNEEILKVFIDIKLENLKEKEEIVDKNEVKIEDYIEKIDETEDEKDPLEELEQLEREIDNQILEDAKRQEEKESVRNQEELTIDERIKEEVNKEDKIELVRNKEDESISIEDVKEECKEDSDKECKKECKEETEEEIKEDKKTSEFARNNEEIEILDFSEPEPKREENLFKECETKKNFEIPVVPINKPIIQNMPKEETKIIEKEENTMQAQNVESIFMSFDNTQETYSTYRIYIVRENDSIETILNKYKISKEQLEEYNNLQEIKIGTKIIIPNTKENE